MKQNSCLYLLIAHGSPRGPANESLWDLVSRFRKAYPKRIVEGCFLRLADPLLEDALEACIQKGAAEIILLAAASFIRRPAC
jgi:sirohydrochlorin cobaltochelatase